MDFAASLMRERDYFRAVSIYKEVAFFASDPALRLDAQYHVGRAYRLAGRYSLSLRSYTAWLAAGGKDSSRAGAAYASMAAALLGMKAEPQAAPFLDLAEAKGERALAELYRGVSALRGERFSLARAHFERSLESDPRGPHAALAREMMAASERAEHAPQRSPVLAGIFSTVVPGAGQAYTGHYVDAVQAFGFVGLLGWSSFMAYKYEASRDGGYPFTIVTVSLTALFHAANVVGAVRTADFYNRRQRELAIGDAISKAVGLDF